MRVVPTLAIVLRLALAPATLASTAQVTPAYVINAGDSTAIVRRALVATSISNTKFDPTTMSHACSTVL